MGIIEATKLGAWFDAYARQMALYARQWLSWPSAADAVQDVFLRLARQNAEPRNVKAWLFRSVRNAAISQVRSHWRRRRREQEATADRKGWFETRPDDLIDARAAQEALAGLPVEQREVVVLRIWADMPWRDIGEVTASPTTSVRRQYIAALAAMRERMESPCKKKMN